MIDPKELRIGNWLQGKPFNVPRMGISSNGETQITGHGIAAFELHETSRQPHEPQIYSPIPLTPEWLERLGFEKRESGVCYEWWNGINEVTHDWLVSITEMKDNGQFFYRNGKHTIKYVHQLQNLFFSLCGEEL